MSDSDRIQIVRDSYRAFESGDRELAERIFGADLSFHSPPDPSLDRDGYFERCWPNAGHLAAFEFVRLFERGDEVFVTYEASRGDGTRFRNTEVLTVRDAQIVAVEVYFGRGTGVCRGCGTLRRRRGRGRGPSRWRTRRR